MTRTPPPNTIGGTHFLTITTAKRQPLFAQPILAQLFCQVLTNEQAQAGFAVIAFVVMPDHVHLLVNLDTPQWTITHFAWAVKGKSGRAIAHWARQQPNLPDELQLAQSPSLSADRPHHRNWQYRIWQSHVGYDFLVWSPAKLLQKIIYIHQNPARTRLTSQPENYPYSSAANYASLPVHPSIEITQPRNQAPDPTQTSWFSMKTKASVRRIIFANKISLTQWRKLCATYSSPYSPAYCAPAHPKSCKYRSPSSPNKLSLSPCKYPSPCNKQSCSPKLYPSP